MGTQASTADKLVDLIENIVIKILDKKSISTIHKEGIIKSVADSNSKYTVTIDTEDYQIYGDSSLGLNINDVVVVQLYNGNFQKKWILCKKPKW